jgi:hypothetical protein
MNDQWTDRLSEYLDGELTATERAALETHLPSCADCRATLADLRGVVARAQGLEPRPPATNLWPGIHARLTPANRLTPGRRPGVSRRSFSFSVPQLLAASIALVLLSGGAVWMALNPDRPAELVSSEPGGGGGDPRGGEQYASRSVTVQRDAIAKLEEVLARNEGQLDTATVRVVRHSLATIDRAIAQAQRAIRRDPNSAYLKIHLANTMRQKIELLRRANALAVGES